MYFYKAFTLNINSEISFPELALNKNSKSHQTYDVTISLGDVIENGLIQPLVSGLYYQLKPNEFWLHIPSVARFLVTSGNKIIIAPYRGVAEDSWRTFVLGPCIRALLIQRDFFILHGATLKQGEHSICFMGDYNMGKSTLLAAFLKKGYSMLSDDICLVNSQHHVIPGLPHIELWEDSASLLNIKTDAHRKVRPHINKFTIPFDQQFCETKLPIKTIYILTRKKQLEIQPKFLSGDDKIQYLQRITYNRIFVTGLKKDKLYLKYCENLADKINIVLINRPISHPQLEKYIQLIETTKGLQYETE